MARLIDVDALIEKYTVVIRKDADEKLKTEIAVLLKVVDAQPTVDAVPIEFIEKRIAELKKLNEYEFVENGGYTSPSDYEQWELERLIRDWRERND